MTYNELWRSLTDIYDDGEAKAIVRLLFEVRFGMNLTDILCGKIEGLSGDGITVLNDCMERLRKSEPIQYILGQEEFGGRIFKVAPGVLIPRPETYELCKEIIKEYNRPYCGLQPPEPINVLDIGIGSGCIGITLALVLWNSNVTAWDISSDALIIARENAHRLEAKVNLELKDALNIAEENFNMWDIIVSNPPYICEKEKTDMTENVLRYEPDTALFVPDNEPLKFYRAIAEYGIKSLKRNGMLAFEINPIYANETICMLKELNYKNIRTVSDIFGKQRFTICYK